MNLIIKAFRLWWHDAYTFDLGDNMRTAINSDRAVEAWRIEEYIEQAYHQGREDAVRDMQAHVAEMTSERLAVDQAIRLSKANKREVA